jgi:hypothetical protein
MHPDGDHARHGMTWCPSLASSHVSSRTGTPADLEHDAPDHLPVLLPEFMQHVASQVIVWGPGTDWHPVYVGCLLLFVSSFTLNFHLACVTLSSSRVFHCETFAHFESLSAGQLGSVSSAANSRTHRSRSPPAMASVQESCRIYTGSQRSGADEAPHAWTATRAC